MNYEFHLHAHKHALSSSLSKPQPTNKNSDINECKPPTVISAFVWDKDVLGKDFLGQVVLPLGDLIPNNHCSFLYEEMPSSWYTLEESPLRRRQSRKLAVSGELCLRIGWLLPLNISAGAAFIDLDFWNAVRKQYAYLQSNEDRFRHGFYLIC